MKKLSPIILLILLSTTLLWGQKTFENKKFGFSMQAPKNWLVIENSELTKNLEKLDLTEADVANLLKNSKTSISLTAYVKYDFKLKSGLIPKIQIDVRLNKAKNLLQFKTAAIQTANDFKKIFGGFEFIQEPKEIEISGIKSVSFIGKFTLKTQKGAELKVKSRVLAIPYKNYFFQITMVDGQVEENNSKLFDEIIETIKIGN
jgi:hypothetical protein